MPAVKSGAQPPPGARRSSDLLRRMCALAPGDEARLQGFFQSHTVDTIYDRYGGLVTTMTYERAHELVAVDQQRDCAFAIFSPDGQEIHAVGRYCLDPSGESAELAFVVREDQRRRGLATALMQRLIGVARSRGLKRLWGQVNIHNAAMIGLFRRHHFTLRPEEGLAVLNASLRLSPSTPS